MRKQAKKCVVLLLALSLILSCVQISPVLAEGSTGEVSSTETTKIWDFEDAEQINDFDLGKFEPSNTSSANWTKEYMEITDGYLYAKNESSTDGQFKKTILKETDLAVKSVSVDFYPENYSSSYPSESTSDVMKGGIYVGYADEVTKTGFWRTDDCVFVYLADYDTNTTNLTLNVDRGTSAASIPLINGTNINSSNQLYNTKYPQPLKLTVEIAGPYLLVTVSLLDDETKCFEQIIDLRKDKDTKETGYTSDILMGRVGLGSHGWGAKFDNFTVELDTNMDARTWDFNQAEQINDFELTKTYFSPTSSNNANENFKIENGSLCGSNDSNTEKSVNGRIKKAILKEKNLDVKNVSVDIYPQTDVKGSQVLGGGIYVGYADEVTPNAGWREDDCVFVYFLDNDVTKNNDLTFYITRGRSTSNGGQTVLAQESINSANTFYTDTIQPLHLDVEIAGPYLMATVSLLNDETVYKTMIADVRVNKDGNATEFTSDILKGRIGFATYGEGASFDNFTVNGDIFTVGGINDSQIAVSKYGTFPTGADVVDGKYILGWSKNGVDMGATATYKKVADTYEANVVDPAMLGLSSQTAASTTKEGRYDVRFIGSLNEFFNSDTNTYENYKRAGFVFTLDSRYATADKLIIDDDENCVTKTTYNLYSGLNETVNSATETKTPADIYGSDYANYFFAYEITGVSIAEGKSSRTIYARAYLQLENGDIVYGEPSSVTVGDTSKEMDVYLIAGQSNAAGRSAFTTDSLSGQNTAYVNGFSNVLYSGAAYNKTAGNLVTLQPVKAGFGAPDDSGNIIDTMGPEVGMADAFSTYYNETSGNTAGIVKLGACAVSLVNDVTSGKNSYLGNWVSPSYEACLKKQGTLTDEKLTGGMYAMFVEQVIASLQQIREAGYEPNIKGIYWMQGENDREDCQEYVQAFRYFATDIRSDLSTLAGQDLSNMPIIIGEISRTFNSADEQTKNETFIAMQNTLPDFVSNCYIADISDYDVNEMQNGVSVAIGTDRGHYNEADCLAIGKLVGSLMMKKAGVLAE